MKYTTEPATTALRRTGVIALALAGAAAASIAMTIPAHAGPIGDNFAQAETVTGFRGAATLSNTGATAEAGEPSHATLSNGSPDKPDHSVWFRWKSPTTGTVVFRTRGSSPDTVMAAYSGSSLTNLTRLDYNDDTTFTLFDGSQTRTDSQVAFEAKKGVEYRIAVDSFTSNLPDSLVQTGKIKLTWNANDDFAGAQPLAGPTGTTVSHEGGDNTGASLERNEPKHDGKDGGNSIWYSWKAPKSGLVTFKTTSSDIDTLLAAYTGSAVDKLTKVASNDDAAPGQTLTSEISFQATANTVYKIAIDGKGDAQGITVLDFSM